MPFISVVTQIVDPAGNPIAPLGSNVVLQIDGTLQYSAADQGSTWLVTISAPDPPDSDGDAVDTDESTSSTSYVDLATVGPTVTLTTGTEVDLWWTAEAYKTGGAGNTALMSVSISGATTRAATDVTAAAASSAGASTPFTLARSVRLTGLTPGESTFKCEYKVDGSTFHFRDRSLVGRAVP